MTTAHVFIAISLDGFIARPDGDISWLLQRDDPGEDHGYLAFTADKDMIVMGRGSYEKVLTLDPWPYELPVLVLSKQLAATPVPESLKAKVQFSNSPPRIVMEELASRNVHRVYVDGGRLVLGDDTVWSASATTTPVHGVALNRADS